MVSRKIVRLGVMLLVGVCVTLSYPLLGMAQHDVTMSVENGSEGDSVPKECSAGSSNPGEPCTFDTDCPSGSCLGVGLGMRGSSCCNPNYPEAHRVDLTLDNPAHDVRRFIADICNPGLGSDLIYVGYEVTPRAEDLNHTITYNAVSQCIEVRFAETAPYEIPAGEGPIATFYFDVSSSAVNDTCADLDLIRVQVVDNATGFFLTHTDNDGQFCYYNCTTDQQCDDGIFCNGVETCFNNSRCEDASGDPCGLQTCDEAADRCECAANWQCNDGAWCNGIETCNQGNCSVPGNNCSSDGDPCTDDCNEIIDTCTYACNAAGPWDSCCQSSSACSGPGTPCDEDVTLTIGNGSGSPSSTENEVAVSLANTVPVKQVSVQICDVDNYLVGPIDPAPEDITCVAEGRAAALNCTCAEQVVGANAGCIACGLLDQGGVQLIAPGAGEIFTITTYDVLPDAPYGISMDLVIDTENNPPQVKDAADQLLLTLPVDGEFSVPCTTTPQCDNGNPCTSGVCSGSECVYTSLSGSCSDGNDCTENDTCIAADAEDSSAGMCGQNKCNVCAGTDLCGDDGDYCSGIEYCEGGACSDTGGPCGISLTCDEGTDVCDVSDVTLTIGDGQEREGLITIALENSSDEVSTVHFDLCDPDKWSWLHFFNEVCLTTGRTSGFTCETSFNGKCAFFGTNSCTTATQFDDCSMTCNAVVGGLPCLQDSECNRCSDNPLFICSAGGAGGDCGFCTGGSNPGDNCTNDVDCTGGVCEFGACQNFGTCDSCNPDLVDDGCVGVDLTAHFPLDRIAAGTGPVAQISYALDPVTIPEGIYADLNPQAIDVQDTLSLPLSVTPQPGRIDLNLEEDCEGNFDGDVDVDAADLTAFLADFGRGGYFNPCENGNLCNGDFLCDGDVDAADLTTFIEDFGRGQYDRPCPSSSGDCVY